MKTTIFVICAFSVLAFAEQLAYDYEATDAFSTEAEISEYTIMSVESPDELIGLLSAGYPPEPLRAILEDESIPEEDRYWLDCRMRGFIAENLYRFYREDGRPREIPCDWIRPGENYWREIMMVNPLGDAPTELTEGMPRTYRESGYLVNLFGEKVGTIAIADSMVRLSRNGRIGVCQTGWRNQLDPSQPEFYFCFLYPDGSFIEIPVERPFLSRGSAYGVSQDGELAAFSVSDYTGQDKLYLYDRNARERSCLEIDAPFFSSPVIAPDNATIVLRMNGNDFSGGQLLDVSTGRVLNKFLFLVEQPCFSQNSERVSLTGGVDTRILNTADGSVERTYPFRELEIPNGPQGALSVSISNNPRQIVSMRHYGVRVILDGISRLLVPGFNIGDLSPNGCFAWLSSTYKGRMTSSAGYGNKAIIIDMECFEEVGR